MDKGRRTFFILLFIIGLLDLCLWGVIIVEPGFVISPSIFLLYRFVFIASLFFIILYKSDLHILHTFWVALLFAFFSVFVLLGMFILYRKHEEYNFQTGLLYHIDKEEGENIEELENLKTLFNLEELRRVAPLVDGMTSESKDDRVAAIQAMEQITDSVRIRDALLYARKDPHKEVQYFANDALKKINDAYMEKIKHFQNVINNTSDPPQEKYIELADCYAAVAKAGIDHPVLLKFYFQEAINYYQYVLDNLNMQNNVMDHGLSIWNNVLPKLISALYYNGDYESCLDYCEIALKEEDLRPLCGLYKARCLFKMKKLSSLKNFARETEDLRITSIDNFLALTELPHG